MNEDLLLEKSYLEDVLSALDDKINSNIKKTEKLKNEVETIGIPYWDEREYLQNCKNKIFNSGKELHELKQMKKSPYFGRMDLTVTEDDNKEYLKMYIGEKSIIVNNKDNLVYDWRSPVANLYYMNNQESFSYDKSLFDLELKRQIEINNSKLENIYDSFKKGATLNIQDTFLQKVLESKKTRNEFEDIIKTIQSNQNNIIRDNLFTNSIVQGVAGSGKTVVLLHKLSYLLYNNKHLNKDKLIFITPSKVFKTKLSKINRSLSLNTIKMITMEEYFLDKINNYIPPIKIKIVDKDNEDNLLLKFIYGKSFNSYLDNKLNEYLISYKKKISKYNFLCQDEKNIYSLINKNYNILKKIFDTKSYNIDNKDDLSNIFEITKKLLKKDNIKKILDNVYLDLKKSYNLSNKTYICNNRTSKCFAYITLWIYIKYGFTMYNDYKYFFIDEMQDYCDDEYKLIKDMEKEIYLNLYGDIDQNILPYIDKKNIDGIEILLKEILDTKEILKYELLENYRNSKQIIDYCNSFTNIKMIPMGINSDEINITNINKKDVLSNIINNFTKDNIVILCNDLDINNELLLLGYEIYTVKEAKGLEFSKVLVIEEEFNTTTRYIAYTRTLDKLFIYKINE